jgi:hypothetical protein
MSEQALRRAEERANDEDLPMLDLPGQCDGTSCYHPADLGGAMESLTVRQVVRPIRYAFLVPPKDLAAVLEVTSICAATWGGKFYPIVPVDESCPSTIRRFDPDRLVNLSGSALPEPLQQDFTHRSLARSDLFGSTHTGRRLVLGLSMSHVVRYIHRTDLQQGLHTSRAALITTCAPEWRPWVSAVLGSFWHLPPDTTDMSQEYLSYALASERQFDPLEDEDFATWAFPIDVTERDLLQSGSSRPPALLFIGDHTSTDDLVAFWNLRASGHRSWFIPQSQYHSHQRMVRRFVDIDAGNREPPIVVRGSSVSRETFDEVISWVHSLVPQRAIFPTSTTLTSLPLVPAAEYTAMRGDDVAFFDGHTLTPIALLSPPYVEAPVYYGHDTWIVEIDVDNPADDHWTFSFPREPSLDTIASQHFLGDTLTPSTIGRHGVALPQTFPHNRLRAFPATTVDVISALLAATGLRASRSKPGIYAEKVIQKMGSLQAGCRVFKIRGVRSIIGRLSKGAHLSQAEMYQIFRSETRDTHGQNWSQDLYRDFYLGDGTSSPGFASVMRILLERRVIRPGLVLQCHACSAREWYHISEVREQFRCRFCFDRQRVPFDHSPQWQYRADGLFRLPESGEGSIAVILALWRLNEVGMLRDTRYVTGINLADANARITHELDFCMMSMDRIARTHEFIIGEAKGFMVYDAAQVDRLVKLSRVLTPNPTLVFATLRDEFCSGEKALFKQVVNDGSRLLLLTRCELDPYALQARCKGAPKEHILSVADLVSNTCHWNLSGSGG